VLYNGNDPMNEWLSFSLIVFFAFFLPGRYLLHRLKLPLPLSESFGLPSVIGLLMFTLASYLLSWANILAFLIPILVTVNYAALRQNLWKLTISQKHRVPLFIVLFLSLVFSLPMLVTGIGEKTALYRTDDIIHLGYINELVHQFPPDNPGVAGVPLRGYHFFSDFIIAVIHKLTGLSSTFLFFHGIPVFTAFLWGLGTYTLVFSWKKEVSAALWAVILVLFGGSFGWWLHLSGHPEVSLRSIFGIDQPASALLNPPYALSVAILLGALFVMHEYIRTRTRAWLILLGMFVGLTPMVKVYAGILLLAGFASIALRDLIQKRFAVIWIGLLSGALIGITYGVFAGHGGYLLWSPLWAPHKVLIDGMPWYGYEEKLYTYGQFGMWWRIAQVELYGVFLFIIGNLGTRAMGITVLALLWLKKKTYLSPFSLTLLIMMSTALIIPLLFLQSIKVFEIIQMGWYYPLFAALFGAVGIWWLIQHTPTLLGKIILSFVIFTATLPSTYESFYHLVYPMPHKIQTQVQTDPYFQIMAFLANDPDYAATVLELPVKQTPPTHIDVLSWYRATLPYPAALGNKRSFFHSQNIDFPNLPLENRTKVIGEILALEQMDQKEATFAATQLQVQQTFTEYDIRYIITQFPLEHVPQSHLAINKGTYYLYSIQQN
jgi:hypothetical protein